MPSYIFVVENYRKNQFRTNVYACKCIIINERF
jgi:hypothetical protein